MQELLSFLAISLSVFCQARLKTEENKEESVTAWCCRQGQALS